jgi:two-component system response regulator YesN
MREEPHIRLVVTDIRMKKMSGLEFIRQLHDTFSFKGKIIILSGYDDFQYARTAMTYGVVDYLLKPVDTAELKRVVGRAIDQMEREDWQRQSLRMMESAMPKLKEELLQRMVDAPIRAEAEPQASKELHSYGLSWLLSSPPAMMVLEPDNLRAVSPRGDTRGEQGLILFAIGNVVEYSLYEYAEAAGPYVMFRSAQRDKWIVIFGKYPESGPADRTWLNELVASLRSRIRKYVKISVSIAVASGEEGASLGVLYRQALQELTHIRLYGSADGREEWEQEGAFRDVDILSRAQALADLLKHGERSDVAKAMSEFPLMVREWNLDKLQDLHQRVFEWLLEVFEAARKAGWKQDHWRRNPLQLWESIQAYDTVEALQSHVANELLRVNEELQDTPRNQVLQKAVRYIQDHYAEPLTVQMIADHVYVTPEWLSTLFKKNYESTVLDYITRLRMEKAKTLLRDVSLKIYQISGMVGYRDTVYFSRLFKKHTGCTPKEYRNEQGVQIDE